MSANTPYSDPNVPDPNSEKPDKKKPEILFRSNRETKKAPGSSFETFTDYIKNNTKDSIAYVVMVIGILLMLFDPYSPYGELIVGIIFSLYFINELTFVTKNIKDFVEEYGLVKSLVLGGALLALFIKVPFFFIGLAAVIAIQLFIWPDEKKL
jgi:membrane-bound ClpP family serine protease